MCWGGGVHGEGDVTNLLHPHGPRRGDHHVVVLPVQHLLVHALEPHRFGDMSLVVVVPAVGVPGKGGRLGDVGERRQRRGRGGGCVGSYC